MTSTTTDKKKTERENAIAKRRSLTCGAIIAVGWIMLLLILVVVLEILEIWKSLVINVPENLLVALAVMGVGVPFLWYSLQYINFKELNFLGVSLKMAETLESKIDTVQDRQLINHSVGLEDSAGNKKWFWIDEELEAHEVPDEETALFLAQGTGIIKVAEDELDNLPQRRSFKSVKEAAGARQRENDIFILYEGTLYYQRSLGYLYKLASWQNYTYDKLEIKDWDKKFLVELTAEDFLKYRSA